MDKETRKATALKLTYLPNHPNCDKPSQGSLDFEKAFVRTEILTLDFIYECLRLHEEYYDGIRKDRELNLSSDGFYTNCYGEHSPCAGMHIDNILNLAEIFGATRK